MPRRLTPEQQLELDRLARVLAVIARRLDAAMGLAVTAETSSKAIERAVAERNLRGLRMARGDMVAMAAALEPDDRRALDRELKAEAGVTLLSLLEDQSARVARIQARGKVTSDEQYYLVREHLELLEAEPEAERDVESLRALLAAYEERVLAAAARRRAPGPAV